MRILWAFVPLVLLAGCSQGPAEKVSNLPNPDNVNVHDHFDLGKGGNFVSTWLVNASTPDYHVENFTVKLLLESSSSSPEPVTLLRNFHYRLLDGNGTVLQEEAAVNGGAVTGSIFFAENPLGAPGTWRMELGSDPSFATIKVDVDIQYAGGPHP